jgi:hypothetical protein
MRYHIQVNSAKTHTHTHTHIYIDVFTKYIQDHNIKIAFKYLKNKTGFKYLVMTLVNKNCLHKIN